MKLPEHVDKLRDLIEAAFDKHFARLGIGKNKHLDIDKLPEEVKPKRLRFEGMLENHVSETGDYEHAREKLIDELTFTLFNRLAAVKVMEAASLFPPVLTKQPEHGDRSFGHKAWLEMNPHMRSEELEGIREYLKHAFNELGETLPLYSKAYPYALLPDAISLNEIIDAFNAVEKDLQVGSDIWQSDDVLGWMYESYNNKKKLAHKDSGNKTEYHKVSLQSQVYTPRWVVQFLVENSLGKLYLEMYPDSEIKRRYKIANAPQVQERKPKPLHEVKTIDPACGSGNFLLYAFDFFYELYVDQIDNYDANYDEKDIPKLIIENNLHGIDLDDRGVQLAQLGLFIKAKKKRRTIGELAFNVVSSDFYLPDYEAVKHIFIEGTQLDRNQQRLIADVWGDLQFAYKFGSLIRLDEKVKAKLHSLVKQREVEQTSLFGDEDSGIQPQPVQPDLFTEHDIEQEKDFAATFFKNLKTAVEQYAQAQGNTFLTSKTRDAIIFLELLTTEYDVATANPPYTSRSDYGPELKLFIDKNYREPFDTYINLYSCFIQRLDQLLCETGKIAMVTPMTFMFISTFEETRKLILTKYHINLFIQYGFGGMFSESVDPAMYILERGCSGKDSSFIKLDMYFSDSKKLLFSDALSDLISKNINEHVFILNQQRILEIVSHPFIFWISQDFRNKFREQTIADIATVAAGVQTSNNIRFLRFWWETEKNKISEDFKNDHQKYVRYAKGGAFNKWSGNLWLTIDWEEDGKKLQRYLRSKNQDLHATNYYFKEGITYSASGRGGYAFRILPPNCIFDIGGSSIFLENEFSNYHYFLAFLNSKLSFYIADCLNPTANIQVGDLKRVPFVTPDNLNESIVSSLASQNVELTIDNLKKRLTEPVYSGKIFNSDLNWLGAVKNYLINLISNQAIILLNEALINDKIFEVYSLSSKDKKLVISKEGVDVANFPVYEKAKDFFIDNYAIQLFDYTLEKVKSIPTICEDISHKIQDALLGILKGGDLEDISKRYEISPLDILYSLNELSNHRFSKGVAQEISFEFLIDVIRDILMEDEDGIIPLVPNAGEKMLLDRIEEKFRTMGFSSAQYSGFDTVLGRPIHEFINKDFFPKLSDLLNLFSYLPKTPFIWHLSSGPEQGFDCYIIIYKWSRDKLMRLRSVYIEHRERSLVNRQSDLVGSESAEAQNEKDRIFKQLKEIETFKAKIDELLAEGYNPVLDDGVGKNIAPLQKKKMIPYEVLNAGQLKKYLNADW